jgi:hypothetical protein
MYCVHVVVYCALFIYTADDILNTNDKLLNTADKVEEYIVFLKVVKFLILIHLLPLNIPATGIRVGPSRINITTRIRSWNKLILEHQYLMVITMPSGTKI